MSRPEHVAPPEVFYGEAEAGKYLSSSRMVTVQTQLTERCVELLALPDDKSRFLLDIGCGTGLSGDVLSELGHAWVGIDIAPAMLKVALARDVEGDLFQADAGGGLFFRTGAFDGAISVSVLQWLCNADSSNASVRRQLQFFFESLYACLRRGARAAFQFYPENAAQMELVTAAAMRAGFSGGIVVDFPHSTRAKKVYLVLTSGSAAVSTQAAPASNAQSVGDGTTVIQHVTRRARPEKKKSRDSRKQMSSLKDRIQKQKDRERRKGRDVRPDSKYSGRKRSKQL
mmetsp:Transcript_8003/g.14516  ORF Transcript_8003/g.14516 Transcript_8003/m.14516 type:complete len:285 (-) Transcript_8003:16-870(-)